jgi:peptidoglycan/LPS O-acetylase OafA/YrhL
LQVDKRNIGLDVARAAAILGVFVCHGLNLEVAGKNLLAALGSGVELFFVLSGFLIGRIYFRSSKSSSFSFWSFWRSRWWRTLPPYFAAILVYVGVHLAFPAEGLHWYYGLFLQNYLGVTGLGPSWSLCVEEHFYLFLPVLALLADQLTGRKSLRYLLPVAFFVPMVLRFVTLTIYKPLPAQWLWFTHLHCDGLIAGVWLAYLFVEDHAAFERLKKPAKWLLPISPLMVIILPIWDPRPPAMDMLVNTIYAVGYAAWVRYLYDLRWNPTTVLETRLRSATVGVALCSYSVYLTHATFDPVIRHNILGAWHRGIRKSLVVLFLTFLLGVIFYILIERPTIISRDRYLNGRSRAKLDMRQPVGVSEQA